MKPPASKLGFGNSATLILCLSLLGVLAAPQRSGASISPDSTASSAGISASGNRVEKSRAPQLSFGKVTNVPTAAALESFTAGRYDGGVLIRWRTGYEIDNLGFRLYRVQPGKRVLITPQLLAGSALVTGPGTPLTAGKTYEWWDNGTANCGSRIGNCKNAQYVLEELDLKGQSIWHGPIDAGLAGGPPPNWSRAATLGSLGRSDAQSKPVQTRATTAQFAADKSPSSVSLASEFAIKFFVDHEGWHRVTQPELLNAGLAPNVDPRKLQLYVDGQPQPISVIGEADGKLDAGDAVEFYGVGLDSAQTDTRVYWLAAGATPGLRITSVPSAATPAAGGSFPFSVERRDRTIYFSALLNGEVENFFGAVVASQPVNQSLTVTNIDAAASGGMLEVAVQGVTFVSHQISVTLNGFPLGNLSFFGQAAGLSTFAVPLGLLQQGANQVTLAAGVAGDVSLVDHVKLTYNHTHTADGDRLKLIAPGNSQLTIGGFGANSVRVFDITDPAGIQELIGQVQHRARVTPFR